MMMCGGGGVSEKHVLSKIARFLVLEMAALSISILLIIAIGVIASSIAGDVYNSNHPIPDPVARGEDLGLGMIMFGAAIGSFLISLPCAVLIHIYIFKKFFSKGAKI